jgi:hypothetical protein
MEAPIIVHTIHVINPDKSQHRTRNAQKRVLMIAFHGRIDHLQNAENRAEDVDPSMVSSILCDLVSQQKYQASESGQKDISCFDSLLILIIRQIEI